MKNVSALFFGLEVENAEAGSRHLMKEMNVEQLVSDLEEKMPTS